jgi:putative transcriptional regulator
MAYMRTLFRSFLILITLCGAGPHAAFAEDGKIIRGSPYLVGKLLVAAPGLVDANFVKSVVLMIEHNAGGAFGLIVNRLYGTGPLEDLVKGFGIDAANAKGEISMRFGGPVERGQVFVVHSADYEITGTIKVNAELSITNQNQVIEDMAEGTGPSERMVVLGYAGWSAGQLESEIARGDWTSMAADRSIIFTDDIDNIWDRANARAGLAL